MDVSAIVGRLKDHERRKEERRITQMKTAREKSRKLKEAVGKLTVAKEGSGERDVRLGEGLVDEAEKKEEVSNGVVDGKEVEGEGENGVFGTKRKIEEMDPSEVDTPVVDESAEEVSERYVDGATGLPKTNGHAASATKRIHRPTWTEPTTTLSSQILTKPSPEMRGHTSYLTFASFYPASIRAITSDQTDISVISKSTPSGVGRVAELAAEARAQAEKARAGSEETEVTEYGSDSIDVVMGTLTEEEVIALQAGSVV